MKRPPIVMRGVLAGEKYRYRIQSLARGEADNRLLKLIFPARRRLLNWNMTPAPPVRLSAELRRDIRDHFVDDVAHLSRLIGHDLGHWLSVKDPASAEQEPGS